MKIVIFLFLLLLIPGTHAASIVETQNDSILINGNPRFPIGVFALCDDQEKENCTSAASSTEFQYQMYTATWYNDDVDNGYPDILQNYGIWSTYPYAKPNQSWGTDTGWIDDLVSYGVPTSNYFLWYTLDEPSTDSNSPIYVSDENRTTLYNYINSVDTNHPSSVNLPYSTYSHGFYHDKTRNDIYSWDFYPFSYDESENPSYCGTPTGYPRSNPANNKICYNRENFSLYAWQYNAYNNVWQDTAHGDPMITDLDEIGKPVNTFVQANIPIDSKWIRAQAVLAIIMGVDSLTFWQYQAEGFTESGLWYSSLSSTKNYLYTKLLPDLNEIESYITQDRVGYSWQYDRDYNTVQFTGNNSRVTPFYNNSASTSNETFQKVDYRLIYNSVSGKYLLLLVNKDNANFQTTITIPSLIGNWTARSLGHESAGVMASGNSYNIVNGVFSQPITLIPYDSPIFEISGGNNSAPPVSTNRTSNLTRSFSTSGNRVISVVARNVNGTLSNTITWNIQMTPDPFNFTCIGLNCNNWNTSSMSNYNLYDYDGKFERMDSGRFGLSAWVNLSFDAGEGNVTQMIIARNCVPNNPTSLCEMSYGQFGGSYSVINSTSSGDMINIIPNASRYRIIQVSLRVYGNQSGAASLDNITFYTSQEELEQPVALTNGTYTICASGCNSTWTANATLVNFTQNNNVISLPALSIANYSWDLDETAGTTAYDSSSNQNDLTHSAGGVSISTDSKYGSRALNFDGTGYTLSSTGISSGSSGSSMGWIKPADYIENVTFWATSVDNGGDYKQSYWMFGKYGYGTNTTEWGCGISNGVTSQLAYSGELYNSTTFPSSQYTHVACTYDGSNIKLYRNGNLIRTIPQTESASNTAYPFAIGRLGGIQAFNFIGKIDEVQLFEYALDAGQITSIMNETGYGSGNVTTYYNSGSGNEVYQVKIEGTGSYIFDGSNYTGTQLILIPNASRVQNKSVLLTSNDLVLSKITYYWSLDVEENVTYSPEIPVNLSCTNNFNFEFGFEYRVYCSWSEGPGNKTDSYNVTFNQNGTLSYTNNTVYKYLYKIVNKHENISVFVYGNNGSTRSSDTNTSFQITNRPIVIDNVTSSPVSYYEGQLIYFDINSLDADYPQDSPVFSINKTNFTVNTSTGVSSWQTGDGDQGVYSINLSVTDNYGYSQSVIKQITILNSTPNLYNLVNVTENNEVANRGNIFFDWEGNNSNYYNITLNGSPAGNVSTSYYSLINTSENTWYNISIKSCNIYLNFCTTEQTMNTYLRVPPLRVIGLTYSFKNQTSINLSWTANIDSDVAQYVVYDYSTLYPTFNNYKLLTGLSPGTQYNFTVWASEADSFSGLNSSILSITTDNIYIFTNLTDIVFTEYPNRTLYIGWN